MIATSIQSARSYRSEAEATARVREIELERGLFDHTFDGHAAWRLLRFTAGLSLQNLPLSVPAESMGRWRWLMTNVVPALRDLPAFLAPRKARYVVKTFDAALSEQRQGTYLDVYFDDLFEGLPQPGRKALCYKLMTGSAPPGKRPTVRIDMATAIIDLLSTFASRLRHRPEIPALAERIAASVASEPSFATLTPHRIAAHLRRFYWSKRLYKWFLRRIEAECVLVIDTAEFAIVAAASELGIRTVEFQHGIFTPDHPDLLPAALSVDRHRAIGRDRVLLFGDYWRDALTASGAASSEFVSVGSTRIDRYRSIRGRHAAMRHDRDICRVVVTTQGMDRDRLAAFIAEALTHLDGGFRYEIHVKLHPLYDRDKTPYTRVLGDNPLVAVLLGDEEPSTFDLLARADVHVSIASACHYDAIGLQVPTVVLPLANHEIVLPLVRDGHAHLAETPADFARLLMGYRRLEVSRAVSEYYFRPGALTNIRQELRLAS